MPQKNVLKESTIVRHINQFFETHKRDLGHLIRKQISSEVIENKIKEFVAKKQLDSQQAELLEKALLIQYALLFYPYLREEYAASAYGVPGTFFDLAPLFNPDDKNNSTLGVGAFGGAGLSAAILITCVGSGIAAIYGMGKDMFETAQELYRSQRVMTNLAVFACTTAAITIATSIAIGLIVSNPPVLAIVGIVSATVVLTALAIKAVRVVAKMIDASLTDKSGLESDSRFQLTDKEEALLRGKGADDKQIYKIKELIRSLAVQAMSVGEVGFFGSKTQYKKIIDDLIKLKRGEIPDSVERRFKDALAELRQDEATQPRPSNMPGSTT